MAGVSGGDDELMMLDGLLEEFFAGGVQLGKDIIQEDERSRLTDFCLQFQLKQLESQHNGAHLTARGDLNGWLIMEENRKIFAVRAGRGMACSDLIVAGALQTVEKRLFVLIK